MPKYLVVPINNGGGYSSNNMFGSSYGDAADPVVEPIVEPIVDPIVVDPIVVVEDKIEQGIVRMFQGLKGTTIAVLALLLLLLIIIVLK
jgi:hypothetical protein